MADNQTGRAAPVAFQQAGRAWVTIFEEINGELRQKTDVQMAVICSLFFGFELYLKALLICQNDTFGNPLELKKLSHNLETIIGKLEQGELRNQICQVVKYYSPAINEFVETRYPVVGKGIQYPEKLNRGEHQFHQVFCLMDQKIDDWVQEHWQDRSSRD